MGSGQTLSIPVEFPGLKEAVALENEQRDMAFLSLGDKTSFFLDDVAGIKVNPFTCRHLLWLTMLDSRFVTGEPITSDNLINELVMFLRVVGIEPRRKWYQRRLSTDEMNCRIVKAIWKSDIEGAIKSVRKYLDDTFSDAPSGGNPNETKYFSSAAAICHFLCSEMKQPITTAMDIPLRVVFQLFKCHKKSIDPKAILFNPSDRVKSKYLQSLNKN